jgi:hypothetical protein
MQRLLVPLVRILLRYGVTHAAFVDISKRVYVRVAARDFQIAGRKQSAARISVLTGLPRKDVSRLLVVADEELAIVGERHSRIARVLSGWRNDARFCDARGRPAALPFEDENDPSFSDLVRRYGGDVTARATLDELLRVGALQRLRDGRLKPAVTPFVMTDRGRQAGILGDDVADLVSTIDHNLFHGAREFFQRKIAATTYRKRQFPRRPTPPTPSSFSSHDGHLSTGSRRDADVCGTGRSRSSWVWYYDHDYDEDDDTNPAMQRSDE